MSLTYNNLEIRPYQLLNIQELNISKHINEHTRMRFTGIIPEELRDSYIQTTDEDMLISVHHINDEGVSKPLFSGLPVSVEVKVIQGVYTLEVEAISHTYRMDQKRRYRSFQDIKLTIPEMLKQIGQDYEGLDVIDEASANAKIGRIAIQYNETDWEFLRRMASRYRTSLMPASQFDTPKFYFGIYESSAPVELDHTRYTVRKRMTPFRYFTENEASSPVNEQDFIVFEVETDEVMELGGHIQFQGRSLYVSEAYTDMSGGLVRNWYVLSSHKGLRQKAYFNAEVTGASLSGKVIDVTGDQVKVHFQIDAVQDREKAHWFPYSTMYSAEGHSGWYVMPEIGDPVSIYFPSSREEEGIGGSAVRQDRKVSNSNKLSNPNVKIFRTPSGKEIRLAPDEIVITSKEEAVFIKLNDHDGIHIQGSKGVTLSAGGNISLSAKKSITMSADGELNLDCKGSHVHLGSHASITGAEVKSN
ncbi:phage baseplate assembly protein V [Paenibacillus sp. IHBB 10380]|uniref:phage baseplate assembly protein V n=1 Tax=Paenibacillus sp. IHBB 10380 TaxID=1566358 RepID=UPI0005CFA052|nr:phage baseplate assembly protein V [Paenibacillus sp. IHBB 10380]AJS58660.1 hypothetical protein UB51_09380 [Paenibacillus sp. IHBB 10380]